MYIDAKSVRCWKFSPHNPESYFPPGTTFQPNRRAVGTGLNFVNVLCTKFEKLLPILLENNKNHQITVTKGRIGFASLDVKEKEEPKYQIRNPYELTNAILNSDSTYNDCFLLHSTIPAQSPEDFLQILYGTEESIFEQSAPIAHCISADAKMQKGFADSLSKRFPEVRGACRSAKLMKGQVFPVLDRSLRFIYNLVTKEKFSDKPDLNTLSASLEAMKCHAVIYGVHTIAMPKIGCGLDQMNWQEVVKLLRDHFAYSGIQIIVYTLDEKGVFAMTSEGDPEFYAEDEVERYSEEFHLNEKELETDFTSDAKSCQPTCDEQFPSSTPKRRKRTINRILLAIPT